MIDLFLYFYRREYSVFLKEHDIDFPLPHKEKKVKLLFQYLIYFSLPLIAIFSVTYSFLSYLDPKYIVLKYIFFSLFIFFSLLHIVISFYFIYRIKKLRKKFDEDKKEKKKAIQSELVRKISKSLTLGKIIEDNDETIYIELKASKEFEELKKGFERRLLNEKKDVSFNYSIFSILISSSTAFAKAVTGSFNLNSIILLITILFTTAISIAFYSFYKDYYKKNYFPREEELEDIIDLLQEIIIYKTFFENNNNITSDKLIKSVL